MKDEDKTKEQLVNELKKMRQRVAELKTLKTTYRKHEKLLLRTQEELSMIADTIPIILIIVDRKRRVHTVNNVATKFAQRSDNEMIGLRGGEALRCLHSLDNPKGCGYGPSCKTCTVRRTVLDSFETGNNYYNVEATLPFASRQGETTFIFSTVHLTVAKSKRVLVCIEDITERKQAEEKLRESEERMELALEGTDEGIWDWDVKNKGIYLDGNWIRTLGYEHGERQFDFNWWSESIHPNSLPVFEKALSEYLQGYSKYYELEYQMKRKSGEWIWIWARGICVKWDEEGNPLRFIGTHRDITERKQAEEELRESEERYRLLFNLLPYGGEVLNTNGIIVNCSSSTAQMLGYEVSELIGKHISELLTPDSVKVFQQKFPVLLSGKCESAEICMIRKDGTKLNILRAAQPILDSNGKVETVLALSVDITERRQVEEELSKHRNHLQVLVDERTAELQSEITGHKQAEEELRESEEKYRTLVEGLEDAIVRFALDGTILYCSPNVNNFGGYDSKEEIGQHFTKYIADEEAKQELQEFFQGIIKRKETITFEFLYMPKSKDPF